MEDLIFGRNPVLEALKSGRAINKLLVQKEGEGNLKPVISLALAKSIPVQNVSRQKLNQLAGEGVHQGIVAWAAAKTYVEIEDILAVAQNKQEPPVVLLLDHLEDPHNLGAILRTVDASGAHGVIIPKRRTVSLTSTVAKTSSGAVEYVPVARVTNLVQTIELLKEKGCWVMGLDVEGQNPHFKTDFKGPLAIVVGAEGKGLSRLVKEHCDLLIKIPMFGQLNSLNASVAASIVLYEVVRQRKSEK